MGGRRVIKRAAKLRGYSHFSILSFPVQHEHWVKLSLTIFPNSPSVLLPSPRACLSVQGDLGLQLAFTLICSSVSSLQYCFHNLSHLSISFINLETHQTRYHRGQGYFLLFSRDWQTTKSVGYTINSYQTIWADCTQDKGWNVKISCSQGLEKWTWHLSSCLDSWDKKKKKKGKDYPFAYGKSSVSSFCI